MPSNRPFHLEALADFPDDVLSASEPITEAHVEAMMRGLAEAGVRRVSWVPYGDAHGGLFVPSG